MPFRGSFFPSNKYQHRLPDFASEEILSDSHDGPAPLLEHPRALGSRKSIRRIHGLDGFRSVVA